MATDTVAQMTQAEFKRMLDTVVEVTVEQKRIDLFGDPDQGLAIRENVQERLLRQRQLIASGERGQSLDDVMQELELEYTVYIDGFGTRSS